MFYVFLCCFIFGFFFALEKKGSDVLPAELLEKAEMPKVVFIGFGLAALLCLLLGNAALFAWFIIRKRSKGLQFYFNWLLSFDYSSDFLAFTFAAPNTEIELKKNPLQ